MVWRHKTALGVVAIVCFSGCFDGHGRDGEGRDAGTDAGPAPVDGGPGPVDAGPPPPLDAGMCHTVDADEVRAAAIVIGEQRLTVAIRKTTPGGCDCTPRAHEVPDAVLLELCDCCEECDCIDPGYEVGYSANPLPVGEHRVFFGGVPVDVRVADPGTCRPMEATDIEIVPPDPGLIHGGGDVWWARVHGFETVCCVDPAPAVSHRRSGSTFDLTVHSCNTADCDCIGMPEAYAAWHPLGPLPPGTYTVRVDHVHDGPLVTFTVD